MNSLAFIYTPFFLLEVKERLAKLHDTYHRFQELSQASGRQVECEGLSASGAPGQAEPTSTFTTLLKFIPGFGMALAYATRLPMWLS